MNFVKNSSLPFEDEFFLEHPTLPISASNYGRFIVRHSSGKVRITLGAKRRRCNKDPKYEYVMGVRFNGEKKLKPVTHLIMQCFGLYPYPGETIVDHIDNNSENNEIGNLCWVTPKQNANNVNNKRKQK